MELSTLKTTFIKNGIWSFGGQVASLLISLASNIWLARILDKSIFGQMAIIMFFVTIANVLTESGLSGALIRNPKSSNEDYSTVFIFNFFISLACVLLIYISAHPIASFYGDPSLTTPLILTGFLLLINSFCFVQDTKLIVNLKFKRKSIYDVTSTIASSFIGIYTAYLGYELWALVYMQLSKAIIRVALLYVFEGSIGAMVFNKRSFSKLYKFGLFTTASNLINIGFSNVYQLILGKVSSFDEVGKYYQAKRFDDVLITLISNLNHGVIFSGISKIQNDKDRFNHSYQSIKFYILLIFGFILTTVLLYSDEIIMIILGKKWIGTGYYLELLFLASYFGIQENLSRVLFKVYDRTSLLFILEFPKKAFQALTIFIGIYLQSIPALLYGFIVANALGYALNLIIANMKFETDKKKEFYNLILSIFPIILSCIIGHSIVLLLGLTELKKLLSYPIVILSYYITSRIIIKTSQQLNHL